MCLIISSYYNIIVTYNESKIYVCYIFLRRILKRQRNYTLKLNTDTRRYTRSNKVTERKIREVILTFDAFRESR